MSSRQWWNDDDDRLASMLRLFRSAVSMIEDEEAKAGIQEQIDTLAAEQERRERARALPPVGFGIRVRVSELLPDVAVCATPPVGLTGTALGEEYPGATAVQFPREALYPSMEEGDNDDRDPHVILFMPNYSIEAL